MYLYFPSNLFVARPAVHAIGVDSYKEMIGDKYFGKYYKFPLAGVVGVAIYLGYCPGSLIAGIVGISFKIQMGREMEGSEEKESHCKTNTTRWSRRFGGSEAGFETWKTIETVIFEPPTIQVSSTLHISNFRLKRLRVNFYRKLGTMGCVLNSSVSLHVM